MLETKRYGEVSISLIHLHQFRPLIKGLQSQSLPHLQQATALFRRSFVQTAANVRFPPFVLIPIWSRSVFRACSERLTLSRFAIIGAERGERLVWAKRDVCS